MPHDQFNSKDGSTFGKRHHITTLGERDNKQKSNFYKVNKEGQWLTTDQLQGQFHCLREDMMEDRHPQMESFIHPGATSTPIC